MVEQSAIQQVAGAAGLSESQVAQSMRIGAAMEAFNQSAVQLIQAGTPLTDGGFCVYCEVLIVEVGKALTGLPHMDACPWQNFVTKMDLLANEIRGFKKP